MSDLIAMSVGELAAHVRGGELRAREVVTAALERIEERDGGINAFIEVDADGALARDKVQLRREALKDLVLSFARQGDLEEARNYLLGKGGDDGIALVERLATTFFDDGKFDRAIEVYKALEPGKGTEISDWQGRVEAEAAVADARARFIPH